MSSEDDVARALASSVSRVSGASGAAAADASAAVKMPRNAGGSRGCPGCFVAGTLIALLGADAEAIENIRVGDRVQTTQSSSVTAVDSSWRLVELEGVSSGELEESLHVRLLRSPASLEAHGVSGSGDHVYLKLKELGFEGWLRVVGIQDAPEISSGPGRVVLSTFTRLSNDVYEVGFVGGAVLRGTGGHPLWSLDRDDWVSVRDLQVGERLQTAEGAVSVEALEKVRGLHRVYNLEVEGDHEYLVGEAGIRAHNQSACDPSRLLSARASAPGGGGPNIVYRALNADDLAAVRAGRGITAKEPLAHFSPIDHVVDGSLSGFRSQFISMTRSARFAQGWGRRGGNGYIAIDLSRVRGNVIDLSSAAGRSRVFGDPSRMIPGSRTHTGNRLSRGAEELLLEGDIPQSAIHGPFF